MPEDVTDAIPGLVSGDPSKGRVVLLRKSKARESAEGAFGLEKSAKELAAVTREQGMGVLVGKFPTRFDGFTGGWASIGGFIMGESTGTAAGSNGVGMSGQVQELIGGIITPRELMQQGYDPIDHQVLTISPYTPPTEKVKRFEKGFLRTKTTFEQVPLAYKSGRTSTYIDGKRGGDDWIMFEYYAPLDSSIEKRPGVYLALNVVVPSDIATRIEEQIDKNPLFPDSFLKALYPDVIGPDNKNDVTRLPTTKLVVVDKRPGADPKPQVRPFPQPLSY